MAEQFNKYKNQLYRQYEKDNKAPNFTGTLQRQKAHWPAFVEYKKSEAAKERSAKNKANVAKRYIIITWVQVATELRSLSGNKLRPPCLRKGSLQKHGIGPVG